MNVDKSMHERLLYYRECASPDQVQRGLSWYEKAGRVAEDWAKVSNISKEQAAGIIAAVSPTLPWETNLEIASKIAFFGRGRGTYRANIRKAERIRRGAKPMDVLGGPKTRAFCRSIAGDKLAVTVDRHMFKACGHERSQCTPKQYEVMAQAITKAAAAVGDTPREFQAIVWLVIREMSKRWVDPRQGELFQS